MNLQLLVKMLEISKELHQNDIQYSYFFQLSFSWMWFSYWASLRQCPATDTLKVFAVHPSFSLRVSCLFLLCCLPNEGKTQEKILIKIKKSTGFYDIQTVPFLRLDKWSSEQHWHDTHSNNSGLMSGHVAEKKLMLGLHAELNIWAPGHWSPPPTVVPPPFLEKGQVVALAYSTCTQRIIGYQAFAARVLGNRPL